MGGGGGDGRGRGASSRRAAPARWHGAAGAACGRNVRVAAPGGLPVTMRGRGSRGELLHQEDQPAEQRREDQHLLAPSASAYSVIIEPVSCSAVHVHTTYSTSSTVVGIGYRGDRDRIPLVRCSTKPPNLENSWLYGTIARCSDGARVTAWVVSSCINRAPDAARQDLTHAARDRPPRAARDRLPRERGSTGRPARAASGRARPVTGCGHDPTAEGQRTGTCPSRTLCPAKRWCGRSLSVTVRCSDVVGPHQPHLNRIKGRTPAQKPAGLYGPRRPCQQPSATLDPSESAITALCKTIAYQIGPSVLTQQTPGRPPFPSQEEPAL